MGHSLVMAVGPVQLSEAMSHAVQSHKRQMSHSEEFWHGPLEKGMAAHSSILAARAPWTVWKGKKIWHWKMNPPCNKVYNMLLGESREQLLIAPEKRRGWAKAEWSSVADVSSGKSKVWCCKEQHYTGTWNVRSINKGNLDVAKQEMTRVSIDILGISELT